MTGQTNDSQWYIARDGKQHGPLSDVEMNTFVGHSYLRPTDLLWRPGMADWQPAPAVFPAAFPGPAPMPGPQQGDWQQQGDQRLQQPAPASNPAPQQQHQPGASPYQQGNHPQAAQHSAFPSMHPGAAQNPAMPAGSHSNGQGQAAPRNDYAEDHFELEAPRRSLVRQGLLAAVAVALIGGGAFAIATFREPLMRIVSGPPKKAAQAPVTPEPAAGQTAATAPGQTVPAAPATEAIPETKTAALTGTEAAAPEAADPALIEGSAIDQRLQKIPMWGMLKKEYPDWYIGNVAAAEKLSAEKKSEIDVATQLVQGLVTLRRQNAINALAASPEKLRTVATAFLENLRALQALSVGACYGFISKGEMSPGVVEIMKAPEAATSINAQLAAIFEAAAEGSKTPVKHDSAVKADYDMLIGELNKIGWKDDDLQIFSNPRLLAKREPAQVCKMVQDWFVAHLAVQDAAAQERLLYETLKPVISG